MATASGPDRILMQPFSESPQAAVVHQYPPLNFFYKHLHDSIRAELELLAVLVENLAEDAPLEELQERFKFLGQLNQYHSSVEDEVVYPALDSKVKNVTVAYRVEHQDEEMLFEQLAQLVHTATEQTGLERTETIRGLICKVEEIHRTLKKHLTKEEEQLLPLLLHHFSFSEQAELVAQFLYCIPLATVERVLAWLKPTVPKVELEQLLGHMRRVVPDKLLLQLLSDWLKPDSHHGSSSSSGGDAVPSLGSSMPSASQGALQQQQQQQSPHAPAAGAPLLGAEQTSSSCSGGANGAPNPLKGSPPKQLVLPPKEVVGCGECCGQPELCLGVQPAAHAEVAAVRASAVDGSAASPAALAGTRANWWARDGGGGGAEEAPVGSPRPPIKEIAHIHRTICAALEDFAHEAGLLQQLPGVTPQQLALLVERHRFLRSVCLFHSLSEDEIMYPEVRRLTAANPGLACVQQHDAFSISTCEKEHESEVSALEDLGRLIADVRAFVRRGRKEVDTMLAQLYRTARQVCSSIKAHMEREEADVFPLLARHLCATQQRVMVWRTLRAMPLRLLERVMPWVTAKLSEEGTQELLNNIRLGAPASDLPLVQLVARWAVKGQQQAARDRLQQQEGGQQASGGLASRNASCQQLSLLTRNSSFLQLQHHPEQQEMSSTLRPLHQPHLQPPAQPSPQLSRNPSMQQLHQQYHEQQRHQQGLLPLAPQQHVQQQQQDGRNGGDGGLQPAVLRPAAHPFPGQLPHVAAPSRPASLGSQNCLQQGDAAVEGVGLNGEQEGGHGSAKRQRRTSDATGGGTGSWSGPGGAQGPPAPLLLGLSRLSNGSLLPPQQQAAAGAAPALGQEAEGVPFLSAAVTAGARKRGRGAAQPPSAAVGALQRDEQGLAADAGVPLGAHSNRSQQQGHASPGFPSGPEQQLQQGQGHAASPSWPGAVSGGGSAALAPSGTVLGDGRLGEEGAHDAAAVLGTGREGTHMAGGAGAASAGAGEQAAQQQQQQQQQEGGGGRGWHFNPIDHIFQFHQALRQELKQLDADALGLERQVLSHLRSEQEHAQQPQMQQQQQQQQQQQEQPSAHNASALESHGSSGMCGYTNRLPRRVVAAMQALDGRFQFLWGIYKAHSRSEDEIVFPALESKHALRNVSHAYTLDHQEEEKQFIDLEQVMATLRNAPDMAAVRSSALAARRMCAGVRASLETHIRAEESELWPLFTEHFSVEEQQYLVGVIIGRTGAQVLHALLPWISGSFSLEDKELMMGSLRQATKNTMFDQWLDAVTTGNAGAAGGQGAVSASASHAENGVNGSVNGSVNGGSSRLALEHPALRKGTHQEDTIDPDLARYLSISPAPGKDNGCSSAGLGSSGGSAGGVKGRDGPAEELPVESSTFRPGWEDIFRMNQKQLEAAVMRVSADPNLEPGRKAYLIQNIMVSKYIVAQQRRMQQEQQEEEDGSGGGKLSGTDASPDDLAGAAGADPVRYQGRAPRRTYHDAAAGILGCKHYKRRTQLVAPCCGQIFTCRLCHDEAVPSHRMDRNAVSEMVCMECGTRQPVGSHCARCATQMARYYCNICHLFDDQEGRDIYHCPFCNVCRRGRGLGIDFFHCMSCNACMSLSLFKVHNCREKAMESNCPVCSEFLFDSAHSIKELPCGHFMHTRCFAEYTRYNYTCPICSKSVGDMHVYFQMLDSLLASEVLPPEYAGRMQQVLCNDCGKTGFTRFHFAYHSCPHCRSYNTRVL